MRPMLPADLDAVLRIQAACYPAPMQEPAAVVASRIAAARGTCLVGSHEGIVRGYLFAYPSRLGLVTDLNAPFTLAHQPDTLYLHDLAIEPCALGRGLARALVDDALCLARTLGLAHAALVSVQDSARFWQALGWRAAPTRDAGLDTYPHGALYMVRTPA
ncbi:GNAT superfamily N-acetyltransferase [Massilia sp. MP_M2]|uniref:GNAT family N-acetyltransferase n=1 Tax=Massilia sp. MP_M2 TaxID=3071713 RepID=UPI00319DF339